MQHVKVSFQVDESEVYKTQVSETQDFGEKRIAWGKKLYSFLSIFPCSVGDVVVVECSNGLRVCKVREVSTVVVKAATCFVVGKLDLEGLEKMKALRAEHIELQEAMEAKLANFQREQLWEQMAATDPEAAELLRRYKETQGVLTGKIALSSVADAASTSDTCSTAPTDAGEVAGKPLDG